MSDIQLYLTDYEQSKAAAKEFTVQLSKFKYKPSGPGIQERKLRAVLEYCEDRVDIIEQCNELLKSDSIAEIEVKFQRTIAKADEKLKFAAIDIAYMQDSIITKQLVKTYLPVKPKNVEEARDTPNFKKILAHKGSLDTIMDELKQMVASYR